MTLRERIENDKLYQLLIKVKEKPEMFLGDADLNILHGWIIGYNLYKTLISGVFIFLLIEHARHRLGALLNAYEMHENGVVREGVRTE